MPEKGHEAVEPLPGRLPHGTELDSRWGPLQNTKGDPATGLYGDGPGDGSRQTETLLRGTGGLAGSAQQCGGTSSAPHSGSASPCPANHSKAQQEPAQLGCSPAEFQEHGKSPRPASAPTQGSTEPHSRAKQIQTNMPPRKQEPRAPDISAVKFSNS